MNSDGSDQTEETNVEEELLRLKSLYPEKFVSEDKVFQNIHRGDRIFIGTACSEPQYLVRSLVDADPDRICITVARPHEPMFVSVAVGSDREVRVRSCAAPGAG